jgi:hypothetical protein
MRNSSSVILFWETGWPRYPQRDDGGTIGTEFERMAKFGNLAPDLWMKNATGAPVGPDALLQATERALTQVQ